MAFVGQAVPRGEDSALLSSCDVSASVTRRAALQELGELALPHLDVAQPEVAVPCLLVRGGDHGALELVDVAQELDPANVMLLEVTLARSRPAKKATS